MPFLKNFVNSDQGFECLNFVGKDGLAVDFRLSVIAVANAIKSMVILVKQSNVHFHGSPEGLRGLVVPGVDDTCPYMFSLNA